MVALSKPGKMPCRSWSLQAIDTCPGSRGPGGTLVPVCAGCYATGGNYRFRNVKAVREHNRNDWQRADWVTDMVQELDNDRYFRWFDSGDCYDIRLARKILNVMRLTPWTRHWFPTRMYKFEKFKPVLRAMNSLPNVAVRYSADSLDGKAPRGKLVSSVIPYNSYKTKAIVCGAYDRDGKCGPCRACWDKTVPHVAYVAHGQKMANIIASTD